MSVSDPSLVSDAQVMHELVTRLSERNAARAIAALTGAIVLVANACPDPAGIIGCAMQGLAAGLRVARAARKRALARMARA